MCKDHKGSNGREVWRDGVLAGEVGDIENDLVIFMQVVIGESFGIDMTYDLESLFYMYFVGTVACFVWKCSRS